MSCQKRQQKLSQKMNFFTKDFFSKCDQIHSLLRIWSHLLKKSLMENFNFFAASDNKNVRGILGDNHNTNITECSKLVHLHIANNFSFA